MNADESGLRRLRWRCRRGMRELDQLLERYLDQRWTSASDTERGAFLRLLDCEDDRLWRWVLGHERADDADLRDLIETLRALPH